MHDDSLSFVSCILIVNILMIIIESEKPCWEIATKYVCTLIIIFGIYTRCQLVVNMYILTTHEFPTHNFDFHLCMYVPVYRKLALDPARVLHGCCTGVARVSHTDFFHGTTMCLHLRKSWHSTAVCLHLRKS